MARYKLHQKSYLKSNEDIVEILHAEGDIIDVDPSCPPGPHWEPIDDEARNCVKHFRDHPELLAPRDVSKEFQVSFTQAPGSMTETSTAKTITVNNGNRK